MKNLVEGIVQFFGFADWTSHEMSRAKGEFLGRASDQEIADFIKKLADDKVDTAELVVDDVGWEESGGCKGDDLYPVICSATRLPDGRYLVEFQGIIVPWADDLACNCYRCRFDEKGEERKSPLTEYVNRKLTDEEIEGLRPFSPENKGKYGFKYGTMRYVYSPYHGLEGLNSLQELN